MNEQTRLAELLGSLSFAGDLGRGQPMGHVMRTTRIAMKLADSLRVPSADLADVYFTSLLVHAGCTAGAPEFAAFLAGDELSAQKDFCLCDPNNYGQLFGWLRRNVAAGRPLPARTLRMLRLISKGEKAFQDIELGCSEVGARIAARLGLSEATQEGLFHICETWNGKGPHKLKGEEIPFTSRLLNAAMISEVFFSERGLAAANEAAIARKGKSFDPTIADAVAALCEDSIFWQGLAQEEPWSTVLDIEPIPFRYVNDDALDALCYSLADIVDLKSSSSVVHSRRTAELAERLGRQLGLPEGEVELVRRAALVHDVGLVAVPSLLLERGARWSEADGERFRLHTYYTERILSRSSWLRPIGEVAAAHHETIDGSGFHRGLGGRELSVPARVVAVAAAYAEEEDSGGALAGDPEAILKRLGDRRSLDVDCLAALATAVGSQTIPARARTPNPSGLTEREIEVLRLVASGLNLRQTAEGLVISEHTARHHLESVYSKAGVSSRAAAVLFAVEKGIVG